MSTRPHPVALRELLIAAPAKTFLLSGGPLLLALGQFLNSYLTGFSPLIALGFGLLMGCFAVVATGHHAAEYRLQTLEGQ